MLIGMASLISGFVFVGKIAQFTSMTKIASNCENFKDATNFWLAGLQFRHALYYKAVNTSRVTDANQNNAFGVKLADDTSFTYNAQAWNMANFMNLDPSNELKSSAALLTPSVGAQIEDYFNCSQFCLSYNLPTTLKTNDNFRNKTLLAWDNKTTTYDYYKKTGSTSTATNGPVVFFTFKMNGPEEMLPLTTSNRPADCYDKIAI